MTVNDHILAALDSDMTSDAAAQMTQLVVDYLASTRDATNPVSTQLTSAQIAARFDEPLPLDGAPLETVIARLRDDVIADANHLYHPRAVGHQVSPPLPAAIWTESVIAALNQSVAVAEMSPTATMMEHRVIRWMCDLVGYGAASGGTLTSGGTEATLTALLAARSATIPDVWINGVGANPPVIVCGEHTHYAVSRAAGELGLGMRNVITVPSRDWRMNTDALLATLDQLARDGRTVMAVVATAGSTATGSFDDLETIGALCNARGHWLHVDGAHGASALLSAKHRTRLRGLERARSIAWDPHKMMLIPLAAGLLLVRDEPDLENAFSQRAPYLFHSGEGERVLDQGIRSFQCSRRADVIKLWVALQRYGANGIGALYDRLCDTTMAMHDMLVAHPSFVVLHSPEGNILCFRWVGDGTLDEQALDVRNRELRERYNRSGEGWITATNLNGRRVLRVTVMNPRTTTRDVRAIVEGLEREARRPTGAVMPTL
ncbi:MAG: pyridoxal-dependent decarboxylase [bacterium]